MRVYLVFFLMTIGAAAYSQAKTSSVSAKVDKGYLSLQQIARENVANLHKNSTVIYFKNDSMLLDTAGVKIKKSSIFKTTVLRAVKTSYYQNLPDVTFLYIYTTPQKFYIR